MLLSKFPYLLSGLARLQAREDALRSAPMLLGDEEINGLPVATLTARHFEQLSLIASPFLATPRRRRAIPCRVTPVQVAQFLWIISLFNPINRRTPQRLRDFLLFRGMGVMRSRFFRSLKKIPQPENFERAIDLFIERMFFDQPAGGGGRIIPVSFSASVVNRIAAAYGWPAEVLDLFGLPIPGKGVMDMPIPRLFQFWKCILADKKPDAPLFSKLRDNYRDHVVTKWITRARAAGFQDDPPGAPGHLDAVEKYLISIGKLPSPFSSSAASSSSAPAP